MRVLWCIARIFGSWVAARCAYSLPRTVWGSRRVIVLVTQKTILLVIVRLLGCLLFDRECLAAVRTANEDAVVVADVRPVSEFLEAGAFSGFSLFRIYIAYAVEEPGVSGEFLAFNYYQYCVYQYCYYYQYCVQTLAMVLPCIESSRLRVSSVMSEYVP
ncbi:hypothetical protein MRX96_013913 [Rhipicephalus microplus]